MQILRSQSKCPVVKEILRVWDHYKDLRVATKPEDRRWYDPEPRIVWEAESLADLKADLGKVELNDKVHLPKARWWPARGEYRITLRDESGVMEINLDRNPFYTDQYGIVPPGNRFEHQVDVPRVLLAILGASRAGQELYDIEFLMRIALPEKGKPSGDDVVYGLWAVPSVEPKRPIELRVWDVHLNPGEKRGYDPVKGFRALVEHPEVEEKSLK